MYSRVQACFPPWHKFLCKNWQVRSPTFFMSLQRILIQLHMIAKFRIIDQAVRFFCCLNKTIGKACIRCIYQNLVIWISVWHLPTTGVFVFQTGNNDAFFYFVAFKNPCYREVLGPSDITEKRKPCLMLCSLIHVAFVGERWFPFLLSNPDGLQQTGWKISSSRTLFLLPLVLDSKRPPVSSKWTRSTSSQL